MAGAGINESAVPTLLAETNLTTFHMSGKKAIKSAMTFRNPSVSMGIEGMKEYEILQTDSRQISAVERLLIS